MLQQRATARHPRYNARTHLRTRRKKNMYIARPPVGSCSVQRAKTWATPLLPRRRRMPRQANHRSSARQTSNWWIKRGTCSRRRATARMLTWLVPLNRWVSWFLRFGCAMAIRQRPTFSSMAARSFSRKARTASVLECSSFCSRMNPRCSRFTAGKRFYLTRSPTARRCFAGSAEGSLRARGGRTTAISGAQLSTRRRPPREQQEATTVTPWTLNDKHIREQEQKNV